MKIYKDLEKEKNEIDKILIDIKKNSKSNIFLDIFDKSLFIEKLYDLMQKNESITFKIDEETKDYPNFLLTNLPRFIVQTDSEKISFEDFIKKFNELKLEKKGNEYFLTISKKDDSLDLKLKIDKDKTLSLNLISEDKQKKDKVYFGVRSYFYVKKNGN